MLPGTTASPPKILTPRCCPGESRPLRDEPCPFLCAMADPRDLDLRVRLPVAADAVPPLFLGAEVPELAVLAVRDHLGLHLGAVQNRRAQLHVLTLADQQHLEVQLCPDRLLHLLDLEEVAFLAAVLLSPRPDHCVHRKTPYFPPSTGPAGRGIPPQGAERNGRFSGNAP